MRLGIRREPHGGAGPVYRQHEDMRRATRGAVAYGAAGAAVLGAGLAAGAARWPLLTALVCAAAGWLAVRGMMLRLRMIGSPTYQLGGDALVTLVPVLWSVAAAVVGGGLDAVAGR